MARVSLGGQALHLAARRKVQQGNAAADAVGDVKEFAGAVRGEADRRPARLQGSPNLERGGINLTDGVTPLVGDIKRLAIRREGNALGPVTDLHLSYHAAGANVHREDRVGPFADDVEPLAVGGELQLQGIQVFRFRSLCGRKALRRHSCRPRRREPKCSQHS